jgi:lysophospholipase L1-like esterase
VAKLKKTTRKRKIITILLVIIIGIVLFVVTEYLIIAYGGTPVAAPTIPRNESTLGSGSPLKYLVMGDSTSIGQGSDYAHSFAMTSADHLGKSHTVHFLNVGISGARAKDVITQQLSGAVQYKPDVVLLAVGANDVTHFSNYNDVQKSILHITESLITTNCHVKIVLTGSPAVGSVPRFPFPVKQIMAGRVIKMNEHIQEVITNNKLTFAPVAHRTGEAFLRNPRLFARDKFHPNADGYALWTPVINEALDTAMATQPSHCN